MFAFAQMRNNIIAPSFLWELFAIIFCRCNQHGANANLRCTSRCIVTIVFHKSHGTHMWIYTLQNMEFDMTNGKRNKHWREKECNLAEYEILFEIRYYLFLDKFDAIEAH